MNNKPVIIGPKHFAVEFNPPFFTACTQPFGCLPPIREAQALWYYYGLAVQAMKAKEEQIVYEGDKDYAPNFGRLWIAAATAYRVDPNDMAGYWPAVEQEISRQNVARAAQTVLIGERSMGQLKHLPHEVKHPPRSRT